MKKLLDLGYYFSNDKGLDELINSCTSVLVNYGTAVENLKDLNRHKPKTQLDIRLKELNKLTPLFTYFGPHPTSPGSYGVWIDLGKMHEAESKNQITFCYTKTYRGIKTPYIIFVSPEGGMAFYHRKTKKILWETPA